MDNIRTTENLVNENDHFEVYTLNNYKGKPKLVRLKNSDWGIIIDDIDDRTYDEYGSDQKPFSHFIKQQGELIEAVIKRHEAANG